MKNKSFPGHWQDTAIPINTVARCPETEIKDTHRSPNTTEQVYNLMGTCTLNLHGIKLSLVVRALRL